MKKFISALLVIASMVMMTNLIQAEGFSESAVLCKSRTAPFRKYAAFVESCTKEAQVEACNTEDGVADAVACKLYTSEPEVQKFWDENEMTSLLECQSTLSGIGFRYIVADTSEGSRNAICNASIELKPVAWKDFGADKAGLMKAKDENINRGYTKCKLSIRGSSDKILELPGRDCTPETQRIVCSQAGAVPQGECQIRKDLPVTKKNK